MKKIYTFILIFSCLSLFAQEDSEITEFVTNINITLTDTKMTVTYDLLSDKPDRVFDIKLEIETGDQIITPQQGVSGAIRQRIPQGYGRKITWYYTAVGYSRADLEPDSKPVKVNIIADNPDPPIPGMNTTLVIIKDQVPSILPEVGICTLGAGASIFGLIKNKEANDLYNMYLAHPYKYDNFYLEAVIPTTQSEYFQNAQDKKTLGVSILAGGGLIAVGGVYFLLRKIKRRKAIKSGYSFQPVTNEVLGQTTYGLVLNF